jgi:hypothetical protein
MPTKQCQNHATCKGQATDGDHLCQYCRRLVDDTQKAQAKKWMWAGFPKSTDNHHRGYKKGSPK